jgi:DNA polymerase-3 subunit delta'
MSLQSIIGQPLAVDLATQWLARKTNQPLLFYGPEGVGKKTLALEMAKALNCLAHDACDHCPSCKKIAAGNHPDVRVLDLDFQALERDEPQAKQQALRIETIMNERHRLLQSAFEGSWKISVIDDAHRLTPDAANVLLKILEEPPRQTAIFLLTPFRDRLFATLLSRCQPVRFKPLSDEEMLICLKQVGQRLGSDPTSFD